MSPPKYILKCLKHSCVAAAALYHLMLIQFPIRHIPFITNKSDMLSSMLIISNRPSMRV